VGVATGMHEDAAAWERMEEAFGVERRMVEVHETGLEEGQFGTKLEPLLLGAGLYHRGWTDSQRSGKRRAQHQSCRAAGLKGCWGWTFAVEGWTGSDESRSVSDALKTWISTSSDGESRNFESGLEARGSCISWEPHVRSAP
jgi:hypothetical protein